MPAERLHIFRSTSNQGEIDHLGKKMPSTKAKRLKHIKEQEVYFGDIPLMTDKGTFIFNGIERVVVSQLQRSPGVFFRPGDGKGFFIGKIIPYRGAWVEFEYDAKNILYVRLDSKKKFFASVFLRALGFGSDEEILRLFYKGLQTLSRNRTNSIGNSMRILSGKLLAADVLNPATKKVVAQAKKKLTKELSENCGPEDRQGPAGKKGTGRGVCSQIRGLTLWQANEAIRGQSLGKTGPERRTL